MGSFTAGRREIDLGAEGLAIREDGPHTKLVGQVAAVTFNGQLALGRGQRVTYVTERCVMRLTPKGIMVTEIAPGVDLERDVLAKSAFKLLVSEDLTTMPVSLFSPDPMGLTLPEHPSHRRLRARTEQAQEQR